MRFFAGETSRALARVSAAAENIKKFTARASRS